MPFCTLLSYGMTVAVTYCVAVYTNAYVICRRTIWGSSSRSTRMSDVDNVNSRSQPDKTF